MHSFRNPDNGHFADDNAYLFEVGGNIGEFFIFLNIATIFHLVFLLLFQPVLHNWYIKGHGICYPVWDITYKRSLTSVEENPYSGSSRFHLSTSERFFTVCVLNVLPVSFFLSHS